jgi:hypothetical protein
MDFYVSYHHTKFELQTQLICGETKKKKICYLHQLKLFNLKSKSSQDFIYGSNKHCELLKRLK